ncbi:tRNA wybutosine-synthesizing protein 3 homolog [Physella acuta]|uniref:tRNA wybutosine-synthesizing protein 3 homolog n=1 Tax=Physella acuta TaxID=109671 RepID=UPI0027DCA83C|nr:tRNA wybutosine-synthesizing protein 3 homolog [Physella acuta]XP_059168588.1 tRNA wybutosine-synthesizing protein 3 homolog [Physella acuta]
MAFTNQKMQRLEHTDLSRKGAIDDALVELVHFINANAKYFTTSSCSGRIIVFQNQSETVKKKGCQWLYVSHVPVEFEAIEKSLENITDEAVFKFEPMVMHIQCQDLESAQKLHQAAVASGFRNSGITIGSKGKIMMAVRGTHSLEAPLSSKGQVLVTQQYIKYLIESANSKMEENFCRINRFYEQVKSLSVSTNSSKMKKSHGIKSKTKTYTNNKPIEDNKTIDNSRDVFEEDEKNLSLFMFDST